MPEQQETPHSSCLPPYFVYQGPPVMVRTDPVTGYMVTGDWHINVNSGEIVSRFEPGPDEILLDGRVLLREDHPALFEILAKSQIASRLTEDSVVLPDLRGRLI